MKSHETSLKEMIPRLYGSSIMKLEKYHFSIVQACLRQILNSHYHNLNDTFLRFTVFISIQQYRDVKLYFIVSYFLSVVFQ
jgi:hypothetical protein